MSKGSDRRPAGWHVLLAGAVVAIIAYYAVQSLGPRWAGLGVALYCSANIAMVVSSVVAWRRHPVLRPVVALLAVSGLFSVFGDAVFYFLALIEDTVAYPSIADLAYVAAYPSMAMALLLVVRRRTPGWDAASGLDAMIVATGAGYLVYEFVLAPNLAIDANNYERLVSVLYPIGDLMLIVVGARLMLGAGPRSGALRLIGGYLALVLLADTAYSVQILDGTYRAGNVLDVLWMSSGFLMAAALVHPRAPELMTRSSVGSLEASSGRLAVLAVAAVLAPITMIVQELRGVTPHIIAAGIVCAVLFLLVMARMAGLVRAQRHAAITDGLTGLRARRYFEQAMRAEAARTVRYETEMSMLLLDIDHFKRVNDTHGHAAGDRVLVEVAERLTALIRPGDLVARYGGEEFAVLLPGAGPHVAREVAERIRRGIATTPIAVGDSSLLRVTMSVGVAAFPAEHAAVEATVLAADRALYAAKDAGRNRVSVAGDEVSPQQLLQMA